MKDDTIFRICICDDSKMLHKTCTELINDYAKSRTLKIDIIHYYDGTEIVESDEKFDMLFLDIDMPKMDGISAAKILNKKGSSYKIILLTSYVDRYKDGYKVGVFRFVSKPINKKEFFESIDDVINSRIGLEPVKIYKNNHIYDIPEKDILYISHEESRTTIYSKDDVYRSDNTLVTWNSILDDRLFVQTHRSYIVNLSYVIGVNGYMACLCTGEKVPISKRRRNIFWERFKEYDTKYR
jgi:DNA-binding LytR/AlgR family response regulator